MSKFAIFTFDLESISKDTYANLNSELEKMGLKRQIYDSQKNLQELPINTYIGEYNYDNDTELKNALYTEAKTIFSSLGLNGTIFISVSEKSVIGVERI